MEEDGRAITIAVKRKRSISDYINTYLEIKQLLGLSSISERNVVIGNSVKSEVFDDFFCKTSRNRDIEIPRYHYYQNI